MRERLFRQADAAVFDAVVNDLVQAECVVAGGRLALASHQVTLSSEETRISEAVQALLSDAGLSPPAVALMPPASLKTFLEVHRDEITTVFFDLAGPHPMQASPADVLVALEVNPED